MRSFKAAISFVAQHHLSVALCHKGAGPYPTTRERNALKLSFKPAHGICFIEHRLLLQGEQRRRWRPGSRQADSRPHGDGGRRSPPESPLPLIDAGPPELAVAG